jgi:hypothetical protein
MGIVWIEMVVSNNYAIPEYGLRDWKIITKKIIIALFPTENRKKHK